MLAVLALAMLAGLAAIGLFLFQDPLSSFSKKHFAKSVYEAELFADDLCVVKENVSNPNLQFNDPFHAVSLMNIDEKEVVYAENMHERLFPASTTKIMTLYLALTHGNLQDTVTISENAVNIPLDSSRAGFRLGDELTLEQLLYSLMLPSGNDSAIAVAEHISGSVDAFVELMNEEAVKMGAVNTHFTSPHGYQDENHYTTAYDLYLIFSKCIENNTFCQIISTAEYDCNVKQPNGMLRALHWEQSNQLVNGMRQAPEGISVVGGKTGTTDEAGACLLLLSKDGDGESYVSIIMGAETRPVLYENMTSLLSVIPEL